jgi:hypothetical protein
MSDHADFLGSGFSFDAHSFRIWKWYPSIEDVLISWGCMAVVAIPVFLIRRFVPGFRVREITTSPVRGGEG